MEQAEVERRPVAVEDDPRECELASRRESVGYLAVEHHRSGRPRGSRCRSRPSSRWPRRRTRAPARRSGRPGAATIESSATWSRAILRRKRSSGAPQRGLDGPASPRWSPEVSTIGDTCWVAVTCAGRPRPWPRAAGPVRDRRAGRPASSRFPLPRTSAASTTALIASGVAADWPEHGGVDVGHRRRASDDGARPAGRRPEAVALPGQADAHVPASPNARYQAEYHGWRSNGLASAGSIRSQSAARRAKRSGSPSHSILRLTSDHGTCGSGCDCSPIGEGRGRPVCTHLGTYRLSGHAPVPARRSVRAEGASGPAPAARGLVQRHVAREGVCEPGAESVHRFGAHAE